MQEGYRNSQMLKYGFLKVGREVTTIAGAAGEKLGAKPGLMMTEPLCVSQ